jgi:anti-sigma-K factor RskA
MTRPDDQRDATGAYALSALDENERREFEAYLASADEETRAEVTDLHETAALLGLAPDPVVPSAALRASVLAQIATAPQLPPVEQTTDAARPASALTPDEEKRLLAPIDRARARWFQRPVALLGAAAAAVVLVVSGGLVGSALSRDDSADLASDRLAELYAAPDTQRVTADVAGGGSATLVFSHDLDRSAVVFEDLAELPADEVYELWYIDSEGEPRAAGLVELTGAGDGWYVLDGDLAEGDTIGVTVEPAGGSEQPTSDPVVAIPA